MRYLFLLVLLFSGCAHMRQSCSSYCFSRGGSCDHINPGMTRYNTTTGATEERPTEFVCRYEW